MVNRLRSDYSVTSHDPWIGIYALLTRIDQATGRYTGRMRPSALTMPFAPIRSTELT
ncbi:MAG: hypothetical protein WD266_06090 [Balneolales bacterium]